MPRKAGKMVRIKRIYAEPDPADGERYLVDRLWPRGISKEAAQLTDWLKGLAPSDDLRTWFNHEPERWAEFCKRYVAELKKPENLDLLEKLAVRAQEVNITLVYAARDQEHNNAVVLQKLIEERLRKK